MFYCLLLSVVDNANSRQVRWSLNKIRLLALFRSDNMYPLASQVTVVVVWVRCTLLTAEMLNFIDNNTLHDRDEVVAQKVDKFGLQLENLMDEFKLEPLMNSKETKSDLRCLIADNIMNIYAVIIGMKRLTKKTVPGRPVDAITVRAARKVVSIILDFRSDPAIYPMSRRAFLISMYPPSLQDHVLAQNVFGALSLR